MTLFEVDEAANRIGDEVDTEANIIFGSTTDETLEGKIRVSVVATGIDADAASQPRPILKVYSQDDLAANANANANIRSENLAAEMSNDGLDTTNDKALNLPPGTEASYSSPPIAPALMTSGSLHPSADVFVPPPPVDPRGPTEQETQPDPFREAEMINGNTATERKRGPGLLRRVTGVGRARKDEAKREEAAKGIDSGEPIFEAEIEAKPSDEPEQPKLVDVELEDGTGRAQSEDDLLDIPAFLRRQAN